MRRARVLGHAQRRRDRCHETSALLIVGDSRLRETEQPIGALALGPGVLGRALRLQPDVELLRNGRHERVAGPASRLRTSFAPNICFVMSLRLVTRDATSI